MKRIVLLLPLALCFFLCTSAQITEMEKSMSKGVNNALVLELPGTTEKLVGKLWKKKIRDFGGKSKKDKKLKEWFTDEADFVMIGAGNTIDIYSLVSDSGDDVMLTMWVDMGEGFLNSADYVDQWNEAEKFLMRFALEVAREQTKIELAAEEKKLKKFVSNLKKLKKDNERYHKEIEKAKATIAKMEANIAQNEIDQVSTEEEITVQQEVVDKVNEKLNDL